MVVGPKFRLIDMFHCKVANFKATMVMPMITEAHTHTHTEVSRYEDQRSTISMKPICSTGMTGQSSNLGMCVIPKTYLH